MDISVIIPVFNEEGNLNELYKELKFVLEFSGRDYEIIFVNDGSIDNSSAILNDLAKNDGHVTVIHFERNYGMTSAVDAGFKCSCGDFILTIDADLQYRAEDLIKVFQELKDYDVVICYRINRGNSDGFIKAVQGQTSIEEVLRVIID